MIGIFSKQSTPSSLSSSKARRKACGIGVARPASSISSRPEKKAGGSLPSMPNSLRQSVYGDGGICGGLLHGRSRFGFRDKLVSQVLCLFDGINRVTTLSQSRDSPPDSRLRHA